MTPFVIDNQVRRRYISILVLLLLISFVLGYGIGFFAATHTSVSGIEAEDTVSPQIEAPVTDEQAPEASDKNDAAAQPEIKSDVSPPAKAENKVQNKTASDTSRKISQTPPSPPPASPAKATKPASPAPAKPPQDTVAVVTAKPEPPAPTVKAEPVVTVKSPAVVAAAAPAETVVEIPPVDTSATATTEQDQNTAQNQPRIFSVQVGMFASRENAMNLVEELKNGGFDAYLEDFVASGGEVKYNVRFGRESDRNLIQQQLTRFKQQFSTSAYIIISK